MRMRGRHQWTNANLAIRIAEILRDFNFKISKENIVTGIETTKHKGRLEFYKNFLFDGAHNAAGAKALKEFLDEFVNQPVVMIFGAMRDKDLTEIGKILFPKAETLILTKPDNPRSMETTELMKFLPESFKNPVYETKTVAEAIQQAREISSKNHLILITGSLYLIGEAQKILKI
jgi:dihydrofolate synthase / folylpolyglutamate synthase